jgi:GH43 family beta-xylosidase
MRKTFALLVALIAVVAALVAAPAVSTVATAATPTTTAVLPLVPGTGADPDIQTYNGKYYMLYNGDHSGMEVRMRVAASLSGLADGADVSVWTPPSSMPDICCHVGWGGYLFPSGGHWYIYMQGDNGDQLQAKSFVLESATSDPLSTYTFKAYIPGVVGSHGYAAGPALVGSQLYMFQTYEGGIYAAKASNPWTLTTGWTNVAQPASSGWECAGGRCIDEGSNILVRGSTVYNIFSAGGYEDPNYCVGMMTATLGADLTLPGSWTKSSGCVFSRNDAVGSYGPGSMTWFTSPDGTEDWVAFHVKTTTGTTWDGIDRRLMAKKVTWSGGQPVFGQPQQVGTTIALPSGDPGTVNAAPAVASSSTDSISLFTRSGDGQVQRRSWSTTGGWTGWTAMGSGGVRAIANPAAESHTTNVVDLLTTRVDGSLTHAYTVNGPPGPWASWGALTTPAGGATSAPAGTTWGIDRQSIYVRGFSGHVFESWWTSGTGWSSWRDLGAPAGGALSAPAAVSRAVDRVDVFVRTSGNTLAITSWDGANWSAWQNIGSAGGGIVSNPTVAKWSADRMHVYGTARDGNVYERYWTTAGGWSTWRNLDAPAGGAASSPAVVSRQADLIDVFVRGTNGDLYRKTWDGSAWSGWSAIATP